MKRAELTDIPFLWRNSTSSLYFLNSNPIGDMMNIIADTVSCDICDAKIGDECTGPTAPHGDRLDTFRCEASYEKRLQAHIYITKKVVEHAKSAGFDSEFIEELKSCSTFLTDEELKEI